MMFNINAVASIRLLFISLIDLVYLAVSLLLTEVLKIDESWNILPMCIKHYTVLKKRVKIYLQIA